MFPHVLESLIKLDHLYFEQIKLEGDKYEYNIKDSQRQTLYTSKTEDTADYFPRNCFGSTSAKRVIIDSKIRDINDQDVIHLKSNGLVCNRLEVNNKTSMCVNFRFCQDMKVFRNFKHDWSL
jgi:hypothetical protein